MDLKFLLCEPVSKLAVKANEKIDIIQQQQQQNYQYYEIGNKWHNYPKANYNNPISDIYIDSPKSLSSSISTCSSVSTSSNGSDDFNDATPGRSRSFSSLHSVNNSHQQKRRRAASDVSLHRHHMFIFSHPNRRPRSESAGNDGSSSNVQTRTPWTPFEDHLLQQGYDQGLSWAMISSTYLPHRSRGCCWGRFKTLQNKNMIDPTHSHMRHFRRPWKAIDFNHDKQMAL